MSKIVGCFNCKRPPISEESKYCGFCGMVLIEGEAIEISIPNGPKGNGYVRSQLDNGKIIEVTIQKGKVVTKTEVDK